MEGGNYYMKDHKNPENVDMLHYRNKGVVEIGLKINITSPCAHHILLFMGEHRRYFKEDSKETKRSF